jgi:MFS family permease
MKSPGKIATRLRAPLGLERGVAGLAVALFVYGFGEELWFRYLPEYLWSLGASALAVGLFGTLKDLLDAAYAYPGGWMTDRLGSGRTLILFAAVTTVGIAVLMVHSVAAVFVGIVLVMAWQSLGLPATFSLIGEELHQSKRVVGFTFQAIVKRVPIVIAPPLGGILIARLGMRGGMRAGFMASIALSLLTLWILRRAFARTPSPRPGPASRSRTLSDSASSAPRSAFTLPSPLRTLLAADVLVRLCEGLPDVFLVVWVVEVVHLSPPRFGVLVSILTGTAILSYLPAAALAERAHKKGFIVLTYVFFTLFPLAVLLAHSFAALAAAFAIGGLREIGEPARKAFIVDCAEPSARGRTVGTYYAIRGFSVAGAAAVGGVLWSLRPELTFLVAALLGAAGTVACAVALPASPEALPQRRT